MEYSKVAAKWWADKLREPDLTIKTPDENINNFEKMLANTIQDWVSDEGFVTLRCNFETPFGLDYILTQVVESSLVSACGFPSKATMVVRADKVEVCEGQSTSCKTIFPIEG